MSVLINMEMPTNCCQCPVRLEVCKRGYKYLLEHPELYDNRADDCPLIPVPPHGDLIDRDVLKASLVFAESTAEWAVQALRAVLMVIDEMPTVIPASGGNENE